MLALILMEWQRVGMQVAFLLAFGVCSYGFRKLMVRLPGKDRWYVGLIWLAVCAFGADWCGLHLHGRRVPRGRGHGWRLVRPEADGPAASPCAAGRDAGYFLSTGLRTNWSVGGEAVFVAAARAARRFGWRASCSAFRSRARILGWQPGEASIIGWLLQTKALVMIIFANVLVDKGVITSETFTALLLMAVASTMLTVPMVSPKLERMKSIVRQTA